MGLEQEGKFKRDGFKAIAGIDESGRGCERPDAEILTNNGWKFYTDINLEEDKVLSYTDAGFMRWQKIDKVVEKDFEGHLLELKNRGINIVVTPNHYFTVLRRVFKRDKEDNNRLKLVGYKTREERKKVTDLPDNDFIPRGGKWKGTSKEFFKLPGVEGRQEKLVDLENWVAFLGIYLAEGSADYDRKKGSYRIIISQSKEPLEEYDKIHNLLKKLPFNFNKSEEGFKCFDKQLYFYLKKLGNCYTKFIPKDIKGLNPELLGTLIDWMILGDGACYTGENRKEVCEYYTVSERLKDDLEEILLKAGWTYHTTVREPEDRYIEGRLIKKENQVPCFETRLRRSNKAIVKHLHKKKLPYQGKVFCLQLPKHHNFYVRRDGTGYFTGNSLAGPVTAAAVAVTTNDNDDNDDNNDYDHYSDELKKIKGSKQLSRKKREHFYNLMNESPQIEWATSRVGSTVIDRLNILEATKLAMRRAVDNLNKRLDEELNFLLIDGNFSINCEAEQESIVGGDQKVFLISAASVIAKVSRDRAMRRYHRLFPDYRFDRHKGYPTKFHRDKVKEKGPCIIHRKSFTPVRDML